MVIPVYRGERSIPELVERVVSVFRQEDIDGEVILVNDGSPDASWDVICRLSADNANVVGIDLMRNYGQGCALLCGIRAATKSFIVTMDDDQEDRPENIPLMLNKLAEGYDLVYATPEKRVHQPWRNFITTVYKRFLAWATGVPTLARMSACCAFRTHLRDAFADTRSPDVFLSLMLSWGTTKIASVYVPCDHRKFGQSNYNFLKLAAVAIGLITGYTTVPLRLASAAGLALTLFGLGAFIFATLSLLLDHSLREFTFMASLVAVIGGAQLLAIGIIGEYLALMHKHAIDRPAYVIRSRIDGGVLRPD